MKKFELGVRHAFSARRLRLASCFGSGPANPPIGEALAFDAAQSAIRALGIVHAKAGTVRIAEVELGKVAVQMFFAAMLIDAFHAALEHAEIVLDRVRMPLASGPFLGPDG